MFGIWFFRCRRVVRCELIAVKNWRHPNWQQNGSYSRKNRRKQRNIRNNIFNSIFGVWVLDVFDYFSNYKIYSMMLVSSAVIPVIRVGMLIDTKWLKRRKSFSHLMLWCLEQEGLCLCEPFHWYMKFSTFWCIAEFLKFNECKLLTILTSKMTDTY